MGAGLSVYTILGAVGSLFSAPGIALKLIVLFTLLFSIAGLALVILSWWYVYTRKSDWRLLRSGRVYWLSLVTITFFAGGLFGKFISQDSDMVQQTRQSVREIVAAHFEVAPDQVDMSQPVRDQFKADDLDLVELVLIFEEKFNIQIPDDLYLEHLDSKGDIMSDMFKPNDFVVIISMMRRRGPDVSPDQKKD